ncbi:hypothetical protein Avbf_15935 [Armadillidium vulgare]|nr:hypothetical protein Avbf_15935 [Armadillidium vulgare]
MVIVFILAKITSKSQNTVLKCCRFLIGNSIVSDFLLATVIKRNVRTMKILFFDHFIVLKCCDNWNSVFEGFRFFTCNCYKTERTDNEDFIL